MIRSVKIQGYRGLEDFEMSNLARINLLVGKNNSGKSSVLEALYLLASEGNPRALSRILRGRGEFTEVENKDEERVDRELDATHLFFGHGFNKKQAIKIEAHGEPHRVLKVETRQIDREEFKQFSFLFEEGEIFPELPIGLSLSVGSKPDDPRGFYLLSSRGGIGLRNFDRYRRIQRKTQENSQISQYIQTDLFSPQELVTLWDKISLTPHQKKILDALKNVDQTIQDVAAYSGYQLMTYRFFESGRGGFKVKLKGQERPVPIGSLGDGVWRMLALSLTLANGQGGILLIDEIDTGLHYSVQEDLWRMIATTARELDVQVFATTHSYDCITSLASICRADPATQSEVTIQRIEAGKKHAVAYDEGDIVMAAERHIEMR